MNYNDILRDKVNRQKNALGLDYEFIVDSEQAFVKNKDLKPNTIYVLTRELQNELSVAVNTQPIQILILAEQDKLDIAMAFFKKFASDNNFVPFEDGTTWVKQQYTEPVVLSNFNTVAYGYRSVLYMAVTLYIMENVADLNNLYIDGDAYTPLTWDLAYSMTPNTQQLATENISSSVKSVSTLSISMTIPLLNNLPLVTKVFNILSETNNGNDDFTFAFNLGTTGFTGLKMKLTTAEIGTAINDIPAIRLGFIK